jgi:hypothetical protein
VFLSIQRNGHHIGQVTIEQQDIAGRLQPPLTVVVVVVAIFMAISQR